jgi:hypothetical protein
VCSATHFPNDTIKATIRATSGLQIVLPNEPEGFVHSCCPGENGSADSIAALTT